MKSISKIVPQLMGITRTQDVNIEKPSNYLINIHIFWSVQFCFAECDEKDTWQHYKTYIHSSIIFYGLNVTIFLSTIT